MIAIVKANITDESSDIVEIAKESFIGTEESTISKEHVQFSDLITNTTITSIKLDEVLDGGPGKDGIPALYSPDFVSLEDSIKEIDEGINGLLVIGKSGTKKYYPYSILVWHEIANDTIDGEPIVVTFCPLCGSAIVFSGILNENLIEFGVSGKLYESNLLMYDKKTESLWSQIQGEAVVGDRTGDKLEILNSQLISFGELQKLHPDAQVLSTDTGYSRNYRYYPYGDYDENDKFYFPTSDFDSTFQSKEIFYIIEVNGEQLAIQLDELREIVSFDTVVSERMIDVSYLNGEITVIDTESNKSYPGFYAMWFSWRVHNEDGAHWPVN